LMRWKRENNAEMKVEYRGKKLVGVTLSSWEETEKGEVRIQGHAWAFYVEDAVRIAQALFEHEKKELQVDGLLKLLTTA